MHFLKVLNIADLAFMFAGVAVTLLMIVMGGIENERAPRRSARAPDAATPQRKPAQIRASKRS